MGADKAFVTLDGKRIIDRVLETGHQVFSEIIVSAQSQDNFLDLGYPIALDIYKAGSPLAGIHACLKKARAQKVLVVAVDMPFVMPELLRLLVKNSEDFDVAVPVLGRFFEPLLAVYSKACIKPIEDQLKTGRAKVRSFYQDVKVNKVDQDKISAVDPDLVSFININSKQNLAQAEALLAAKTAR